jgi:hypothetical protein
VTTSAEIAHKDAERAELEALMADWQAQGGIPQLVTTCRQEKAMATMAEANAATWRDRK